VVAVKLTKKKSRPRWPQADETHFLNVDLDVLSRQPLEPLAKGFGRRVTELYVGREGKQFAAHFELASSFRKDADALIVGFVRLVRALSPAGRAAWAGAYRRDFNIGIQGGGKPHSFELTLKSETLSLIRAVDANLVVTVYAADQAVSRAASAQVL
jgi:hypothetical protein